MNAIAPPAGAPTSGPALDNRRVLAGLIDVAVIAAGVFVLATLLGMALGGDVKLGPPMIAVALAWGLYYYFALESGDGQTLGKKVMKLRVVREDGGRTSMREIAVRTVVRLVDFPLMYLVGLVTMLVTGNRRQRLGDIAAGTVVVDASAEPALAAASPAAVATAPAAVEEPRIDETAPERAAHAPPMGEPAFPVAPADIGDPLPGVTREPEATPEVSDFTPFAEPAAEPTEPVVEEPTEPVAEEPAEPRVEVAPEPADDPGVQPPTQLYPSVSEQEGASVDEQDSSPQDSGDGSEAAEAGEQPEGDDVNVRSVETVSAMDLIMGDADDEDDRSQPGAGPATA